MVQVKDHSAVSNCYRIFGRGLSEARQTESKPHKLAGRIVQAGFLAQAEHHPFGGTLKPAKSAQAPVAAVKN